MTNPLTKNNLQRVVILGGGFGGVYVLKNLISSMKRDSGLEITLVNPKNYFLFTPLLHEVATGSLTPDTIVEPFRAILPVGQSKLVLGEVSEVKLKDKQVVTTAGVIDYDTLVVALGAETNFFGLSGADQALTLKTLADAVKLKRQMIEAFELAMRAVSEDEILRLLHFIVIGGGPTGVELAGEMADFLCSTFSKYYPLYLIKLVRITLIQRAEVLMPQFPAALSKRSLQVLTKKGVKVLLNTGVAKLTPEGAVLESGEVLKSSTVVWTAGVKPQTIKFDQVVELTPNGRIVVDNFLNIPNQPDVFVLGDMAALIDSTTGKPLPELAQVATKQAAYVAHNIGARITGHSPLPFKYKSSGTLVSLGEWQAVGRLFGLNFTGRLTWWLWRTIYLSKLISGTKKLKVMLDWTINLFFPRDISELS